MVSKRVRFVNFASDERREYGVATLPFKKGEWFGSSTTATLIQPPDNRPFYLRAFGAKFDDGSYRYGQAFIPLAIPGNSEKVVELTVSNSRRAVAPPEQQPLTIPLVFAPPVIINNQAVPSESVISEQMESNVARTVFRFRYRTGDFVVVVYVYIYAGGQSVVPFEVRVTASNPQNQTIVYPANSITFHSPVPHLSIYGAQRRGAQRIDANSYLLAANTSFGDGQSQCWFGNAYLSTSGAYNPAAAEVNQLLGISLDWKESKAFGPFGTIPDSLAQTDSLKRNYATEKYNSFRNYKAGAGSMWDDLQLGLGKYPGMTGAQDDFGMLAGWDVMDSGCPELLERYRFAVCEEAMRPGHYMEISGSPVTHAAHPNWVSWSGATFWSSVVCPDKLGKNMIAGASECNGWLGKDVEHWSSNLLSAAGVLTNSYQIMDELNVEAELFLSGHTIPTMRPGWSTNSIWASRAVGRVYHAMAQNFLITARNDVKERIYQRTLQCVAVQWSGKDASPVRPMHTIGPDPRQLPLNPSWLPWQESLGIPGLESWYQITGTEIFRSLAVLLAASFIKYGWRIQMDGEQVTFYNVANSVRWYSDGTPITPEQYFDETFTYYNRSEGMAVWTVTTLCIIKNYYQGLIDQELYTRASQLLDLITANRAGVYDNMGNWLV